MGPGQILDTILDNIKKIVFPEEWLKLDQAMSKQELFALVLVDRRGEIIMSQVADYINVSMSTATGIVDRLVKNGYLERNRSDEDRRTVRIRLSGKGRALVGDIKSIGKRYIDLVFQALTDEERSCLLRIVEKVIAAINLKEGSTAETETQLSGVRKITIE
jgi:DNA-binding MarR family transcriptional regulator